MRQLWFAAVPAIIALAGLVWIGLAVQHFEGTTGRGLYALAGYHYLTPESGFAYHPGGERVHLWTTQIPSRVTLAALLGSLLGVLIVQRKAGWRVVLALFAAHVLAAGVFAIGWFLFEINITGLFI